jgi:hypothetical protein
VKVLRITLLASLLLGCAGQKPAAHVDHVIVGVSDLAQGMDQIEQLTGVRSAIGGAHPGAGTQNALLSLGDSYLEILAPNQAEHGTSAEVEELRRLTRPTPIGWAVSTSDEQALRSALASQGFRLTAPDAGSRRKPDGTVLSWVTFAFRNLDHPLAPFFIEWANPAQHPSRTSPRGCTLKSMRIEDPAAADLDRAVKALRVSVALTKAPRSRMAMDLTCPKGNVALGN